MVVIAIIAILAAILFPVFARARENARRASCQSNEKNIALGFKQYIQDSDEVYPNMGVADTTGSTTNALVAAPNGLEPYVKSMAILVCPSDSATDQTSYIYDPAYGTVSGKNESTLTADTIVLLGEDNTTRHFNGQNQAFIDGHVKWRK